jgi:polar amino acid transport system substrate-binding protein
MHQLVVAAVVFAAMAGAVAAQAQSPNPQGRTAVSQAPADVVKDLAPTGTLRAAINLGNIVLAQGTPDAPCGVTVDLARELGRRLGVPVALKTFDAAGKSFEAAKAGEIDILFLAIEPVRAAEVIFTAPYVIIEGVYAVPKDSPLKTVADVDREGVRIAVNKASAYDLFLTRSLKHAKLVRGEQGVDVFRAEKLEAVAGVKQAIVKWAAGQPDVRVIDGRFMEIRQAMGTPRARYQGREAAPKYLAAFVEEMKASGFVADALKRSNQPDATVAPPEKM